MLALLVFGTLNQRGIGGEGVRVTMRVVECPVLAADVPLDRIGDG